MVDLHEIESEIRKCEADKTSWNNCERLAILYTVRDHLDEPTPQLPSYSYASEPAPIPKTVYGDSEFLAVVSGADLQKALEVLDEHMKAVKMVYPKEYAAVIRKIKNQ